MIHGKICMCEDCTVIDLQEKLEKTEREKEILHGNYDTLALGRASAERELDKARATIERVKALVEKWINNGEWGYPDELEAALEGGKNEV